MRAMARAVAVLCALIGGVLTRLSDKAEKRSGSKTWREVMPHKGFFLPPISHNRAEKKGNAMLLLIVPLGLFVVVHAVRAVRESLRGVPRSNRDWIWY
jgi:hypothetical protein